MFDFLLFIENRKELMFKFLLINIVDIPLYRDKRIQICYLCIAVMVFGLNG